ncbi:MAG: hypothetical protein ACFWTQ_04065 [Lactococcus sp.]
MKEIILTQKAIQDIAEIENYIMTHYSVPNDVEIFRENVERVLNDISVFLIKRVTMRSSENGLATNIFICMLSIIVLFVFYRFLMKKQTGNTADNEAGSKVLSH